MVFLVRRAGLQPFEVPGQDVESINAVPCLHQSSHGIASPSYFVKIHPNGHLLIFSGHISFVINLWMIFCIDVPPFMSLRGPVVHRHDLPQFPR